MRTKLFLAGLVLASALGVAPSYADVIYSTFGPGNTFVTGNGGTIAGASSAVGAFVTQATEFTSPGDYSVGQIDLAFGIVSGTNAATVILLTESGGLPDAQLGSWAISGMGTFGDAGSIVSITGITGINLTSGTNYFLQIVAADDAWEAWNENIIGATGTVLADSGDGSGWQDTGNAPYAFDLLTESAAPAPEPITVSMFGAGLLSLSAMRRRKKAA